MARAKNASAIIAGIGIMLLIFDNKNTIEGARIGLDLCVKAVIPSLFPFLMLSMMLTASIGNYDFSKILRLSCVLHIPQTATPVLIPAFLGGYPVGAKCVADLYNNGILDKEEAERLLAFCNNAGPSFLFGMLFSYFPNKSMIWILWAIHIAGAIFTAMVFPSRGLDREGFRKLRDSKQQSDLMVPALKAIAVVCGWVVIFRALLSSLSNWVLWRFPKWMQILIMGVVELTNGCCELQQIEDIRLRFILCSGMLSLGGICVLLQTASVVKDLSLRNYLMGKLIQCIFSVVISCIVISENWILLAVSMFLLLLMLIKEKNKCRNPSAYPI